MIIKEEEGVNLRESGGGGGWGTGGERGENEMM